MSLILPQVEHGARQPKVWVGDGLPPIPKKLHERILKWEFIELSELLPSGALERVQPELEPQKFIIMPGLEVARPRKKPIESITQWIRCFAIYVAVLATEFCCSGPTHIYGHHASTERVRRASLEIV